MTAHVYGLVPNAGAGQLVLMLRHDLSKAVARGAGR